MSTKYKAKCYKSREEKELLIVTNDNLELFFLDDISSDVFCILKTPKSIEDVIRIMISELYDNVSEDVLRNDIQEVINTFLRQGLMEAFDEY